MPELPEVETVRTALELSLRGQQVDDLIHCTEKLRHRLDPDRLASATRGRTVGRVRRRGKYIVCQFADSQPECLLIHLGMTGAFRIEQQMCEIRRHDHVVWRMHNGDLWVFTDPRKFGSVAVTSLSPPDDLPGELAGMGPEPLSSAFDGSCLWRTLRGKKQPVKSLLLDQRMVAGIGNIYASEALFRAGINPRRAAGRISRCRTELLVKAVKEVLQDAIACGGTTIRDFQSLDGTEGHFSICLAVYGKEDVPCLRCGPAHPVRRIVQAGRSTFYCPNCQR